MTHVMFDALKYVERLKAAGMPEMQAKALTEAQNDAWSYMTGTVTLIIKSFF